MTYQLDLCSMMFRNDPEPLFQMEAENLPNLLKIVVKLAVRLAHHNNYVTFISVHAVYYSDSMLRLIQK